MLVVFQMFFLLGEIGNLIPNFSAKKYGIQEYLFHMMAYVHQKYLDHKKVLLSRNATKHNEP